MSFRTYTTLRCQHLTSSNFTWANTTHQRYLIPSDETVPDTVNNSASQEFSGNVSAGGNVISGTFICPYVFDIANAVDGMAKCSLKISTLLTSSSGTNYSATITGIYVNIYAVTSTGTVNNLSGGEKLVWSGTHLAPVVGTPNLLGILVWVPVSGLVKQDERLIMTIRAVGQRDFYGGHRIYHTLNDDDCAITIPFII
jgi:hypothetical protein